MTWHEISATKMNCLREKLNHAPCCRISFFLSLSLLLSRDRNFLARMQSIKKTKTIQSTKVNKRRIRDSFPTQTTNLWLFGSAYCLIIFSLSMEFYISLELDFV